VNQDLNGNLISTPVWTGSREYGAHPYESGLGDDFPVVGFSLSTGKQWVYDDFHDSGDPLALYGISPVLTVPFPSGTVVPFHASLHGTIVMSSGNTFVADDTGHATHLGAFTAVQTYVFSSSTNFIGSVVFTAANGDMLDGTFEGVDTSAGVLMGTFTLHGGTGRFAHATGEGMFMGVDNRDGTFTAVLDGTISYEASDRRH
jgi:hypothetical protein